MSFIELCRTDSNAKTVSNFAMGLLCLVEFIVTFHVIHWVELCFENIETEAFSTKTKVTTK